MAKPSKKLKVNIPTEDPKVADPEKQTMSESLHQTSEAAMDDPPPEEHHVTLDYMDVNPATSKPLSPVKPAEKEAEDVIVTGVGYTEPGNPIVLSTHSTKEEFSATSKGKWKLDLESYAQFNAHEIHAGYLNRLHTSRDFEPGLVILMKESFKVSINNPFHINIYLSAAKSTE